MSGYLLPNFPRTAYGANPHADRNPNDDHGWGGHEWPAGVPADLLAVVTIPGGVRIVVRKELAELVAVKYQIAKIKYGRTFERGWTGGYENRPIAGTTVPSNHSRGKAIDNDAATNPMSFEFHSDLPPQLVADWESLGFYWGGRYVGKTDSMHFEYAYAPTDVAAHVAQARSILSRATGGIPENPSPAPIPTPTPTPVPTPPEEDDDMAAKDLKLVRTSDDPNQWWLVDPIGHTMLRIRDDNQKNFHKAAWSIEEINGVQAAVVLAGYTEVGSGK